MKNPPLQQGHDGPRAPPLRPYQADTLQRMKSYEGNAALCVIATGLGKTRIFAEYIRCDVLENDHHILILSHREELVIQPLEYLKGLPCGIEQGTTHAHGEPIISASVQSLVGRLDKYNPYSIDTIIIDEAHHSAAPTYRKIFEYFKNAVRFGFTATAIRGDGVGLDVAFDDILCEYNTLYGIEHGYLSPIEACQVNLKYDLGTVQYVYQDLKQKHAKYQHIWDKKQRYKWDRQPITNEQIALIHKLAPDYKIDTHKMTRGDASRAIQLLTYKPEEWTPQTTPSEVQDHAKKSP